MKFTESNIDKFVLFGVFVLFLASIAANAGRVNDKSFSQKNDATSFGLKVASSGAPYPEWLPMLPKLRCRGRDRHRPRPNREGRFLDATPEIYRQLQIFRGNSRNSIRPLSETTLTTASTRGQASTVNYIKKISRI